VLLFCALDLHVILIPNVGGPIIMYSKEHIGVLLLVLLYYCFEDKEQER